VFDIISGATHFDVDKINEKGERNVEKGA